jgi:hypothetical protein
MFTDFTIFNISEKITCSCYFVIWIEFGAYRSMKWPRYRTVINLEIQVGITSQINIWANTDPRKYWRWDQVPRRSKRIYIPMIYVYLDELEMKDTTGSYKSDSYLDSLLHVILSPTVD